MPQQMFVLSPCGTSLLTNYGDKELNVLARKYANAKKLSDIPANDAAQLEQLVKLASESLKDASFEKAAKASAELNGIIKLYNCQIEKGSDYHLILATDTWLGEQTANMVADWLRSNGLIAEVKRQSDLQTGDIDQFQLALSDLVSWCEETLPGYRSSQYRIIFNLTGGFKSVMGFLMILASFYADETVYVFESSDQLLRIPRLPVRMDEGASVKQNLTTFRRLGIGLKVTNPENVPETLLFKVASEYSLSQWGGLVWCQTKPTLYQEQLFPSPSEKIRYAKTFEPSLRGLPKDRLAQINSKIDDLARFVECGQKIDSLGFKDLKDPKLPYTYELYAWSDCGAKRIFGDFDGKIFVIGVLGDHL